MDCAADYRPCRPDRSNLGLNPEACRSVRVNSYFTPERTRALLAGRSEGMANVMAATLGIVTPFCSCSAVPLFIGFVQAGVPLGVTFSFLISAPMVNEVALTLLFGLFGWKIAALYLGLGRASSSTAKWCTRAACRRAGRSSNGWLATGLVAGLPQIGRQQKLHRLAAVTPRPRHPAAERYASDSLFDRERNDRVEQQAFSCGAQTLQCSPECGHRQADFNRAGHRLGWPPRGLQSVTGFKRGQNSILLLPGSSFHSRQDRLNPGSFNGRAWHPGAAARACAAR